MNISEYQNESRKTWVSIDRMTDELHSIIGLAEECGEVCGKIKKLHRDVFPNCQSFVDISAAKQGAKDAITKELGDLMYHACRVADDYGINMDDVLTVNIQKIMDRKKRGVTCGSGDDR